MEASRKRPEAVCSNEACVEERGQVSARERGRGADPREAGLNDFKKVKRILGGADKVASSIVGNVPATDVQITLLAGANPELYILFNCLISV